MDLTTLIAFAVALAVAAAVPGPGVAAIVARALGAGFRPTLPMIAGLITGDLVYLSAAVLGLGMLASAFGGVFAVVRWLGAAYLVYLAIRLWTTRDDGAPIVARAAERPFGTYLAGLAVTLGNPKPILFYLALVPTIVDLTRVTALGYVELLLVVLLVLASVIGAYAALAARARALLASAAMRRIVNRVAGTAMMAAAAALANRG